MTKSMVFRICRANMSSLGNFTWPTSGRVKAPDWKNTKECGNGLHGWFEGQGDISCSSYGVDTDTKFLVLEVETSTVIHLDGKCKFPEASVVFVGSQMEASSYIDNTYPHLRHAPILFAIRTAGANGLANVGDKGIATVGDYGRSIAGNDGVSKAGLWGIAITGDYGSSTADDYGTAIAGIYGTAMAGREGVSKTGFKGKSIVGHGGVAMAGDGGTATSGSYGRSIAGYGRSIAGYGGIAIVSDWGTATAGVFGTVMAGANGVVQLQYCDNGNRVRTVTGYIGENGLVANTMYKLDRNHNFVKVS